MKLYAAKNPIDPVNSQNVKHIKPGSNRRKTELLLSWIQSNEMHLSYPYSLSIVALVWTLLWIISWRNRICYKKIYKQLIRPKWWNFATTIDNPVCENQKITFIIIHSGWFHRKLNFSYLSTQLEVCHHNRNLTAAHNQYAEYQE